MSSHFERSVPEVESATSDVEMMPGSQAEARGGSSLKLMATVAAVLVGALWATVAVARSTSAGRGPLPGWAPQVAEDIVVLSDTKISESVCQVLVPNMLHPEGAFVGTAFAIGPANNASHIMTNAHVLKDKGDAQDAILQCGRWAPQKQISLDPDRYFWTSPADNGADVCVVAIQTGDTEPPPPLRLCNEAPSEKSKIVMWVAEENSIEPKFGTVRDTNLDNPYMFSYDATTKGGNSGSPVIHCRGQDCDDACAIGIHRQASTEANLALGSMLSKVFEMNDQFKQHLGEARAPAEAEAMTPGFELFINLLGLQKYATKLVNKGEYETADQLLDADSALLEASGVPPAAIPGAMKKLNQAKEEAKQAMEDMYLNEETPLHAAARLGLILGLYELLHEEADKEAAVSAKTVHEWTVLHEAADGGNADVVRLVLEQVADKDALLSATESEYGKTALHMAAYKGNADAVTALLDQTSDKDALLSATESEHGWTALHMAANIGNAGAVTALLDQTSDKDALLSAKDHRGSTALHMAANIGNADAVTALLDHTSDKEAAVSAKTVHERTVLHEAADGGNADVVRLVLEQVADKDALLSATESEYGETALHMAAYSNADAVTALLDQTSDKDALISAKSHRGSTALHMAALKGNADAVTALLDQTSDKDALLSAKGSEDRGTALHMAAAFGGGADAVTALLDQASDKDALLSAKDRRGSTALHVAAINGSADVVTALLDQASDKDALLLVKDYDGFTALHNAAYTGSLEAATALLDRASDKDELKFMNNDDGETACDITCGSAYFHCEDTWKGEVHAIVC